MLIVALLPLDCTSSYRCACHLFTAACQSADVQYNSIILHNQHIAVHHFLTSKQTRTPPSTSTSQTKLWSRNRFLCFYHIPQLKCRVDAAFQTVLPPLIWFQSLGCNITDTPETKLNQVLVYSFTYSLSICCKIRYIWKRDVLSYKTRLIAFQLVELLRVEKCSHGSIKEFFEANPHLMPIYSSAFQLTSFSQ